MKETIDITPELISKCYDFATASVASSQDQYAKRNGHSNIEKLKIDIMTGKIGEEVIYQELSKKFPNLTKPDYNVYSKGDKNWNADLIDKETNTNIACKSQNSLSENAYGCSWIFQAGFKNNDLDQEIFNKTDPNHYVAFISINTGKKTADMKAVVKVDWLKENKLFKPTKIENLQSNKLAVYYDDLEKFGNDLWQL